MRSKLIAVASICAVIVALATVNGVPRPLQQVARGFWFGSGGMSPATLAAMQIEPEALEIPFVDNGDGSVSIDTHVLEEWIDRDSEKLEEVMETLRNLECTLDKMEQSQSQIEAVPHHINYL